MMNGKITLSMLESRICWNLGLDESKVKLQMKYNAVMLGPTQEIHISDDEDVGEMVSRYPLTVDVITPPELPEKLSRVEVINKSSLGKNYADLGSNEDEMRDNATIVMGDMSIICMFSVSIHHRFESSFVSFIIVLYHFSSFLHTFHD